MNNLLLKYKNSYLSYFLMYIFYYLSWAIFSVLISVYLMNLGYKAADVSIVVSVSYLASMIAQPLMGMLSDKHGLKKMNTIFFLIAIAGALFFILADNLIEIAIAYSIVLTMINGTHPVLEKIATTSPYGYGKIRIWGTIGYALGSQCAGIIYDIISPQAVFITFIGAMLLCMLGMYGTDSVSKTVTEEKETKKKASTLSLFKNHQYL